MNGPSISPQTAGLLANTFKRHKHSDKLGLVTLCSSPPSVSSYVVQSDPHTEIKEIGMEAGSVVCKWVSPDFGTVISVVTAGSVVEVAFHENKKQQTEYQNACAAVDAENRELIIESMRKFAATLVGELGAEITEEEVEETDDKQ